MAKKKQLTLEEKLEEAIVKDGPYEVPGNWVWSKLRVFCNFIDYRGKTPSKTDTGIRLITAKNIKKGYISLDPEEFIAESDYDTWMTRGIPRYGDVILTTEAPLGNVAQLFFTEKYALAQRAITLSIIDGMMQEYLKFVLLSPNIQGNLNQMATGTTVKGIKASRLKELPLPVPPLKEQQRIVDRIESLFEKLDKAKELIEEAREEFDKRKSAILEKAFRGELTEKWRDKHKILENNLLNDIVDYYMHKLSKSDFIKIKELQDIAKKKSSEMKSKWIKCYIGAVSKVGNGSTPSRKIEEYWNGDIPWVSSGEVKNNRITFTKENITKEGFENSSVKLLNKGSVLIAMIGEGKTRGQSSILDIEATTNQNIAAIDLSHGHVLSEFMWYWLQFNYKKNRDSGNGTGPKALNCQKVRELEFVLPPLEEQKEIVKILDKLLEEESKIEELTQLKDQIELIKKSILAKAFRGELGTNSEEDGSALELLKEILSKDI